MSDRIAFGDESYINSGSTHYGIGIISMPSSRVDWFERRVRAIASRARVASELHWTRISNRMAHVAAVINVAELVARTPDVYADIMIVEKAKYRLWRGDKEAAFYKTYTLLAQQVAKRSAGRTSLVIDNRSDSYEKSAEVVGIVANRMLAKVAPASQILKVSKADSKFRPGVQAADLLTGAICAAHCLHSNPSFQLNRLKRLALSVLAQSFGWDHLAHDTLPGDKINVWSFPRESRATNGSRAVRWRSIELQGPAN